MGLAEIYILDLSQHDTKLTEMMYIDEKFCNRKKNGDTPMNRRFLSISERRKLVKNLTKET